MYHEMQISSQSRVREKYTHFHRRQHVIVRHWSCQQEWRDWSCLFGCSIRYRLPCFLYYNVVILACLLSQTGSFQMLSNRFPVWVILVAWAAVRLRISNVHIETFLFNRQTGIPCWILLDHAASVYLTLPSKSVKHFYAKRHLGKYKYFQCWRIKTTSQTNLFMVSANKDWTNIEFRAWAIFHPHKINNTTTCIGMIKTRKTDVNW